MLSVYHFVSSAIYLQQNLSAVLTNYRSDYDHEVEYVPDLFKIILTQGSELQTGFKDEYHGEKPVEDLCLQDTRSQLLLKKL